MSATGEVGQPKSIVIEQIKQRMSSLRTKEGSQKALSFVPRPTDIIIVTPPKCGTTWMQQIVHQLRSGGDMTFTDIDDVVPWIELAYDVGQDLDDEHKYQPRCFKTHACYEVCQKGAKYIVIFREPCAAFYSAFNFYQGKYFQPGELTLDDFVKNLSLVRNKERIVRTSYFEHLVSWWPKRNDPNVLLLLYEDMLEDLENAVKTVAFFMGIDDEGSIKNAMKMSTFDYMKENHHKFVANRISSYRNKAMGIPEDVRPQRVVTGSATKGRDMMQNSTKEAVQKTWNETVSKQIGLHDYNELRSALTRKKTDAI